MKRLTSILEDVKDAALFKANMEQSEDSKAAGEELVRIYCGEYPFPRKRQNARVIEAEQTRDLERLRIEDGQKELAKFFNVRSYDIYRNNQDGEVQKEN